MKKLYLLPIALLPLLGSCSIFAITKHEEKYNYVDYLKEAVELSDFHTELYVFPKVIDTRNVSGFKYYLQDDLLTGSYLFYLETTYSRTDFNIELARLATIGGRFSQVDSVKPIIHNQEESYFLTIYRNGRYEYVLYDDEALKMVYVSNQLFSWSQTEIEEKYILDKVTIPEALDDGDNSYNMYYYYDGDIGYYVED